MSTTYQIKILERLNELDGIEYKAIYVELPYIMVLSEIKGLLERDLVILSNGLLFITDLGKKHLAEYHLSLNRLPTQTPPIELIKTHNSNIHKGTGDKRKWKNEAVKYIVYPLLVGIMIVIILKIFNVI